MAFAPEEKDLFLGKPGQLFSAPRGNSGESGDKVERVELHRFRRKETGTHCFRPQRLDTAGRGGGKGCKETRPVPTKRSERNGWHRSERDGGVDALAQSSFQTATDRHTKKHYAVCFAFLGGILIARKGNTRMHSKAESPRVFGTLPKRGAQGKEDPQPAKSKKAHERSHEEFPARLFTTVERAWESPEKDASNLGVGRTPLAFEALTPRSVQKGRADAPLKGWRRHAKD